MRNVYNAATASSYYGSPNQAPAPHWRPMESSYGTGAPPASTSPPTQFPGSSPPGLGINTAISQYHQSYHNSPPQPSGGSSIPSFPQPAGYAFQSLPVVQPTVSNTGQPAYGPLFSSGTSLPAAAQKPATLQMVHTCFLDWDHDPPIYRPPISKRFVEKATKLYQYGGFATRVSNGSGQFFDVMICADSVCDFCTRHVKCTRAADIDDQTESDVFAAEESNHIDPEISPFKGLPYFHARRDCGPGFNNLYMFSPKWFGDSPVPGPDRVYTTAVFNDKANGAATGDGTLGARDALMCSPGYCAVCMRGRDGVVKKRAGVAPPRPVGSQQAPEDGKESHWDDERQRWT